MQTFNPNQVSFDEGLERIRTAAEKAGLDTRRVITSRDPKAAKATELLTVTAIPGGFRKWQLPVHLSEPSQLFVTVAEPNAEVPEHAHEEGDGIRFIASGSIEYDGMQLSTGDWMFIPKGQRYSFRVGPVGAVMCYCYCCCCAGRADLFADPGGPVEAIGA